MMCMMRCQSEVSELHIIVLVEENVLRLEVSMDKTQLMDIVEGIHYLRKDLPFQIRQLLLLLLLRGERGR